MRTRFFVLGGLLALLAGVMVLRWPRLPADLVSVTHCDARAAEMVVEYRMPRPFEVGLSHGVRKPLVWPEGPGIHVGSWSPLRREAGVVIPSAYDWVRGEYYVRLAFIRGPVLTVEANGRRLEFPAWFASDEMGVRWHPPGERVRLGDGIGKDIVSFAESAERHEYLILYAGTDIRNLVD